MTSSWFFLSIWFEFSFRKFEWPKNVWNLDRLVTETVLLCETGSRFCQKKKACLLANMWAYRAWVCGHSSAEIVGSNPTGDMDDCLLWVLCVFGYRSLRRADHSSRGVLPNVARRCMWSRNLENEEAMARVGPQHHKKKKWARYCSQCTSVFL